MEILKEREAELIKLSLKLMIQKHTLSGEDFDLVCEALADAEEKLAETMWDLKLEWDRRARNEYESD